MVRFPDKSQVLHTTDSPKLWRVLLLSISLTCLFAEDKTLCRVFLIGVDRNFEERIIEVPQTEVAENPAAWCKMRSRQP